MRSSSQRQRHSIELRYARHSAVTATAHADEPPEAARGVRCCGAARRVPGRAPVSSSESVAEYAVAARLTASLASLSSPSRAEGVARTEPRTMAAAASALLRAASIIFPCAMRAASRAAAALVAASAWRAAASAAASAAVRCVGGAAGLGATGARWRGGGGKSRFCTCCASLRVLRCIAVAARWMRLRFWLYFMAFFEIRSTSDAKSLKHVYSRRPSLPRTVAKAMGVPTTLR
mmetsp:Transcript_394/g.1120  ORF Transcript_394/g.1120 Transcript_394/m.1120 type:complete len:233 (+) Transcript_394:385-1083(+)